MILTSDHLKHSVLAIMLLAILLAFYKGRHAVSANGRSLAWTQIPLIAFLAVSIGPSVVATLIYLGYKFGLLQAGKAGYHAARTHTACRFDLLDCRTTFRRNHQLSGRESCAVVSHRGSIPHGEPLP